MENNNINQDKSWKNVMIAILLIIVLALSSFIVYKEFISENSQVEQENNQSTNENEKQNNNIQKSEARNLTDDELNYFKQFFNSHNYNGFVIQSYDKIENIDIPTLLYNGFDFGESPLTEDEKNEYFRISGNTELNLDLTRIKGADIKRFLNVNANYDFEIGTDLDCFSYSDKYKTYYHEHSDTNFMQIEKCTDGKILENGNYEVTCKFMDIDAETTVTLEKPGDNYVFISNKCIKGCSSLLGHICKQ